MRKFLLSLACLALLLITPALAETYSFHDIRASLDLPDDVYDVVLTPANLAAHSDWLTAQGLDYDATLNRFTAEGVLLQAHDSKNSRTLLITARDDVDAQTYFDLNNQNEDMRREYRVSHTDGSAYSVLGYSYSSAKWRNYGGDELRFLQTKYSLRQDGEQYAGYQRRTIRNGYTITLDMQVTGRAAKDADENALESVMKGFSFTEILPMPPLPIALSLSSAPPSETNEDTFTVKGVTGKKATVTATVFSMGAAGSQTYTDTATSSGAFSLKIKLPSEGVYSVTLTAQAEDAISAQRAFSVTYQKGLLSVDLTAEPGDTLGDVTVIAGSTISGAKTQVSVSGPKNYSKSTTSREFNFKLDTEAEGEYIINLTITKKGLKERTFSYTATRTYNEVERAEKIKDAAQKISYANLQKTANEGKTVRCTGYITGIQAGVGEWVLTLAQKKSGDTYREIIYVICAEEPAWAEGAKVTLYGKADGAYTVLADGDSKNYPRVIAHFFEAAE